MHRTVLILKILLAMSFIYDSKHFVNSLSITFLLMIPVNVKMCRILNKVYLIHLQHSTLQQFN